MQKFFNRLRIILSSRRFFTVILGYFVFQSVWIALSAVYPQAFDENFHFGIIKVYSHYWLPFLTKQPTNANAYGALARDPSYLYHYLMSFPYRLIALFIHGQTSQIIILRFIDIVFFVVGLILFRAVLLHARMSKAMANLTILIFTLIPIVPQLAAHISYDDLLIPLTAWACLLTFQAIDEIRARKPTIRTLLTLAIVCLLTSLVKDEFLPIFVSIGLFLSLITYQTFHSHLRALWSALAGNWHVQSKRLRIVLVALVLICVGMFVQRDVVNVIKYHGVVPDCSVVLSVKQCEAYSPWYANYTRHLAVEAKHKTITYYNPVAYVAVWSYWIWFRLFFAVNGPTSGFTNYPPLPLPSATAIVLVVGGLWAIIVWRRYIFDNPYLLFLSFASALYILVLLADGYAAYRYTDVLVDMNGRYLLPIIPLLAAVVGRAFNIGLRHSSAEVKSALALLVFLLFLQGGGFLTFISRSDFTWDWPNSTVVKVNNAARDITKPVLLRGYKQYPTKFWVFN
jgi:hypothetical protein